MIADAVPTDVPAIMACERQPGYEDTVGRWSHEEHLAGLAEATHRYFVGRDAEGHVAGFIMLQKITIPADAVLIRRIAAIRQGCGYGTALLAHALDFIFGELCAKKAFLYVWPHNARGIALYSKFHMRDDGVSNDERDGVRMTIMATTAETYKAWKPRSIRP